MASQRDIRRRIGAVKNIKQITRAMQFVAASKLKRAQDLTLASRPYNDMLEEVLADVASVLGGGDHPLLVRRDVHRRCLVVFTSDRGFAGALNANVIRATVREIGEHGEENITLVVIGRKGRELIRRGHYPMEASFLAYGDRPAFADVLPLARLVTDDYLAGAYDAVDLIYSQFVSTLTQRPVVQPLLPIQLPEEQPEIPGRQFIFEPSAGAVLEQILPRYVATRLYQAVLENTASFYSSQMVAMKNATENAEELIGDLTLSYNKLRQANITREMIEIASGAEAL